MMGSGMRSVPVGKEEEEQNKEGKLDQKIKDTFTHRDWNQHFTSLCFLQVKHLKHYQAYNPRQTGLFWRYESYQPSTTDRIYGGAKRPKGFELYQQVNNLWVKFLIVNVKSGSKRKIIFWVCSVQTPLLLRIIDPSDISPIRLQSVGHMIQRAFQSKTL